MSETTTARRGRRGRLALAALGAGGGGVALAAAAAGPLREAGMDGDALWGTLIATALYAAAALASLTRLRTALGAWLGGRPGRTLVAALALVLPYGAYAIGIGTLSIAAVAMLAGYAAVIATSAGVAARAAGRARAAVDLVTIVALWWPFEAGWLAQAWPVPESGAATFLAALFGLALVGVVYGAARDLPGLKLGLVVGARDVASVVGVVAAFYVVAVPFALVTRFVTLRESFALGSFAPTLLAATILGAWPEELLFRGLLQNRLGDLFGGRRWVALGVTSVLFGLTHLNNEPLNDWRYVVLATFAGAGYGYLYLRSRSIVVPAFAHGLLNALHQLLFLTAKG
jgi:membrane protease YdiL (CAAX protease family)